MKRLVSHLTYANVMATIAVFIAVGGASYAAIKLPKNSVGSKQIRKNAITTAKIKNGAVTGAKIKVATLGAVPSATEANHAVTADRAASLTAPESVHYIGDPGEPKFEGGFSASSNAPTGFYKDHGCRVHFVGEMEGPGGTAFTLPPGFRPLQPGWAPILAGGPQAAQLTFSLDGKVQASYLGGGTADFFGLDSASFRAAGC